MLVPEEPSQLTREGCLFMRKLPRFNISGHAYLLVWWDVEEYGNLTISKIIQSIKSHSAKEIAHYLKTGRRKRGLNDFKNDAWY